MVGFRSLVGGVLAPATLPSCSEWEVEVAQPEDEQVLEALGEGEVKGMWAWTVLRLLLGWSFLWAFIDKMFGLGSPPAAWMAAPSTLDVTPP